MDNLNMQQPINNHRRNTKGIDFFIGFLISIVFIYLFYFSSIIPPSFYPNGIFWLLIVLTAILAGVFKRGFIIVGMLTIPLLALLLMGSCTLIFMGNGARIW